MLEPGLSTYAPIIDRPVLKWPNNARVALWVAPNVEYMDYIPSPNDGKGGFYRQVHTRTPSPDVAAFGLQDYGNRVCLWRMLEVFDHHKIRCTVSINEGILEHFPETKEALLKRDYAFMSHGIYNNRFLNNYTIEEERAFFKDCVDTLKRHTGKQLKGMLTPAVSPTENTAELMAEAGLIYNADWGHDDEPFPMNVKSGRLISMPYNLDLNDGTFNRFGNPPDYWAQCIKDQFDVMYREGAHSAKQMCVSLHPAIIGLPSRIDYLDDVLGYMMSHEGVWQTTADDMADYYMENHYDTMVDFLTKHDYSA
jgi:peptidoglycan/xylan/chitin deacetylase (PgdA/CDA1 family)